MRPATIRRLLVLGVCSLGVVGLYLLPGVAGPSARVDDSRKDAGSRPATPEPVRYVRPASTDDDTAGRPGVAGGAAGRAGQAAPDEQRGTAGQTDRPDREAPSTVTGLTVADVTPARLTIRWSQATDNVSVTRYRVWLNGFEVADTADTQAEVKWFNDGFGEQVVQVRALDAAGNQSTAAPARLVERPGPEQSGAPSAAPQSGKPADPAAPDTSAPDQSAPTDQSAPNGIGSDPHGAPSSAPSASTGSSGGDK